MKSNVFLYFFCLLSLNLVCQLSFKKIPTDLQMIPRDKNNIGHFKVSGNCTATDIKAVRVTLLRNTDGSTIYNFVSDLQENGDFLADVSIPSALADYELKIYSVNKSDQEVLEKRVKELVCGDFFIVGGQSNAAGALEQEEGIKEDSIFGNKYCRTIGSMFQFATSQNSQNNLPNLDLDEDCRFLYASSNYWAGGNKGCIGLWPLRIMNQVVKTMGIPVCIINGAIGGTFLNFHLATHTPSDPLDLKAAQDVSNNIFPSPYDRVFKKLFVNDATSGVKAIFWYQGENDAALSKEDAESYNKRFAALHQSWKVDYPNLEKIFVFQLNVGCGGDNMSIIREQQRRMSQEFDDVLVMSTVGSLPEERQGDACHYSPAGHKKLGENMALPVLKYLYKINLDEKSIIAPDIKNVFYSGSAEICLEFNTDVTFQESQHYNSPKDATIFLKDYFYKKDKKNFWVRSLRCVGNKIFLVPIDTLEEITTLSYLPDIRTDIPSSYVGPWILNKNNTNVGALSFFEFPVKIYEKRFWNNKLDSLVVYPNPASDQLAVRTRGNTDLYAITLYDLYGKKVFEIRTTGEIVSLIDMRPYENGLYFLSCESNLGTLRKKIIVKR